MAVAIRLTRVGATKRPAYRVIAIDKRRSRDGRALEILGFYDPLTEPATVQLDTEKINAWIGKGAQPSETVVKLMKQARDAAAAPATEKPKRAPRAGSKPSKKAAGKAATPAAPESAAAPASEEPAAEAAAAQETTAEPVAADETAAEPEATADAAPAADDAEGEKADA